MQTNKLRTAMALITSVCLFSSGVYAEDDTQAQLIKEIKILSYYSDLRKVIPPSPMWSEQAWQVTKLQKYSEPLLKSLGQVRFLNQPRHVRHDDTTAELLERGEAERCHQFVRIMIENVRQVNQAFGNYLMNSAKSKPDKTTRVLLRARLEMLRAMYFANLDLLSTGREAGLGTFDLSAGFSCTFDRRDQWIDSAKRWEQELSKTFDVVFGHSWDEPTSLAVDLVNIAETKKEWDSYKMASFIGVQVVVSIIFWKYWAGRLVGWMASSPHIFIKNTFLLTMGVIGAEMAAWHLVDDEVFLPIMEEDLKTLSGSEWASFMREQESFLATPLQSPHLYSEYFMLLAEKKEDFIHRFLTWAKSDLRSLIDQYGSVEAAKEKKIAEYKALKGGPHENEN